MCRFTEENVCETFQHQIVLKTYISHPYVDCSFCVTATLERFLLLIPGKICFLRGIFLLLITEFILYNIRLSQPVLLLLKTYELEGHVKCKIVILIAPYVQLPSMCIILRRYYVKWLKSLTLK